MCSRSKEKPGHTQVVLTLPLENWKLKENTKLINSTTITFNPLKHNCASSSWFFCIFTKSQSNNNAPKHLGANWTSSGFPLFVSSTGGVESLPGNSSNGQTLSLVWWKRSTMECPFTKTGTARIWSISRRIGSTYTCKIVGDWKRLRPENSTAI